MAAHILRRMSGKSPVWLLKFLGNLWPPYLGSGIRISYVSKDYRHIKVELKRKWYNSNYVGTQFGGSIYSMTDPFYMLMLINNLGKGYTVWDKGAIVNFIKPGRTRLSAEFNIDQDLIDLVKIKTQDGSKYVFDMKVVILDDQKQVIAEVIKTLYVRKRTKIT